MTSQYCRKKKTHPKNPSKHNDNFNDKKHKVKRKIDNSTEYLKIKELPEKFCKSSRLNTRVEYKKKHTYLSK